MFSRWWVAFATGQPGQNGLSNSLVYDQIPVKLGLWLFRLDVSILAG